MYHAAYIRVPNFCHKDHHWRLEGISLSNMAVYLKVCSLKYSIFRTSNKAN